MGAKARQQVKMLKVLAMFGAAMFMTQLAYVYVAQNNAAMLAVTGLTAVALTLAIVLEAQQS